MARPAPNRPDGPRGRRHQDIAADLGLRTRTVPRWLNASLEAASTACRPKRPRERHPESQPNWPTSCGSGSAAGRRPAVWTGHVGRLYPADKHQRVVLISDNAPWHAGEVVRPALADNPHLERYRLPSYSPKLNVIERFWKLRRRRATHNRLFGSLADLKRSIRASLSYFQTVRARIATLVEGCYTVTGNETASANS